MVGFCLLLALEVEGESRSKSMDPTASRRDTWARHGCYVPIRSHVVELPFYIGVPKPVYTHSPIIEDTTVDSLVVQVEMVVSNTHLPGTHAADAIAFVWLKELSMRPQPFKRAGLLVVMVVFAC